MPGHFCARKPFGKYRRLGTLPRRFLRGAQEGEIACVAAEDAVATAVGLAPERAVGPGGVLVAPDDGPDAGKSPDAASAIAHDAVNDAANGEENGAAVAGNDTADAGDV